MPFEAAQVERLSAGDLVVEILDHQVDIAIMPVAFARFNSAQYRRRSLKAFSSAKCPAKVRASSARLAGPVRPDLGLVSRLPRP